MSLGYKYPALLQQPSPVTQADTITLVQRFHAMQIQQNSITSKYILVALIGLWLLTFPAKGVLFQLSLYLLPLSVLFLNNTRALLRAHSRTILLPLTLLLCLPLLASEILHAVSTNTSISKEPFSAFWRLALFPLSLTIAAIACCVSQRNLQYMFLVVALIYAITAIAPQVIGLSSDSDDRWGRAAGLVFNPNPFGLLMATATLVSVHQLFTATRRWGQWAFASSALLFFIACLASGSRSAIASTLAAGILLVLLHRKRLYRPKNSSYLVTLSGVILAGLASVLLIAQLDLLELLGQRVSATKEGDIRLDIWAHYLRLAAENPWLGKPISEIARFSSGAGTYGPHNIYLDILVRSGIIGLTAFMVCLFAIIRTLMVSTNPGKAIALPLLLLLSLFGLFSGSIYSSEIIQGVLTLVISMAIFSHQESRGRQV